MPEYTDMRLFFALPPKPNEVRGTVTYTISLPVTIPVPVRIRMQDVVNNALQRYVDTLMPEDFEFTPKKHDE